MIFSPRPNLFGRFTVYRSREVKQSWVTTFFTTLYATVQALFLVGRLRPGKDFQLQAKRFDSNKEHILFWHQNCCSWMVPARVYLLLWFLSSSICWDLHQPQLYTSSHSAGKNKFCFLLDSIFKKWFSVCPKKQSEDTVSEWETSVSPQRSFCRTVASAVRGLPQVLFSSNSS